MFSQEYRLLKYKELFITILAACLLCIDTEGGLSFHSLTTPLLTAFLLSWPTSFLTDRYRLRKVVQLIVGEAIIAVCTVDAYCQSIFAVPITPQILSNIMLSDHREMYEFFAVFVNIYILQHWRIAAMLILVIALPVSLFWIRSNFRISVPPYLRITWIVILLLCAAYEIPTTYRYTQLFRHQNDLQSMEGLIFRHYHEELPTPLHRFTFAYYALKQSEHVLDNIRRTSFAATVDSCSYLSPHIVLIIGESYNKHHSTLYGYHLPTTPLQQKRAETGELVVFNDVVTPWNITTNAILDILSTWEYGMPQTIGEMPLVPMLFQKAGYEVTFFSNQFLLKGFRKGATNQAGHFFLANRMLSDSLFTYRNKKTDKYDMGLVHQVKEYIEGKKGRNEEGGARKEKRGDKEIQGCKGTLDIIHLVGHHFDYSMRYPSSATRFSVKDYADRKLDDDALQTIAQYDNATYYNDMVMDSILSIYEHEDAIVVFVADHGEEVYDDMPIQGRLFQEPTAQQARQEFEVPMWIWMSQRYRENHPQTAAVVIQAADKPLMTDGLSQLMLSLAGIGCQWYNDSHNVLSTAYKGKRRIIGGTVDYDHLMK